MGAMTPLALSVAPELAKWLFADDADAVATAVAQAVQAATGTADVEAAKAVLQQSPSAAVQLRRQLIGIADASEKASSGTAGDKLAATLRDVADARAQTTVLSSQRSALAWSAPVISAVVLLTFGVVVGMVLVYGMPVGAETAANMLLGTLAAMATSVVSYWVGSSAGSARKDDRLAQTGK